MDAKLKGMSTHDLVETLVNDRTVERMNEAEVAALLRSPEEAVRLYAAANDVKEDGIRRPMTLSSVLDCMLEPDGSELDGFERMLRHQGIFTKNDLRRGIYASPFQLFYRSPDNTALLPEYVNRVLRAVAEEEWDMRGLVAESIPTDNGTYKQPYLDMANIEAGLKPVGEGGEFSEITLAFTEYSKTLHKRGAKFTISYEALRRMPINMFELALRRIALANATDKAAALVEAITNGATAAPKSTYAVTGDTDDAGSILYGTWLNLVATNSGRVYSKVIGRKETIIQVLLMAKGNVDVVTAIQLLSRQGGGNMGEITGVQNKQWAAVDLIVHPSVGAWELQAIDPRYAMLEHFEIGADIVETEKVITKQLQHMVVSMSSDYSVFDSTSIRRVNHI